MIIKRGVEERLMVDTILSNFVIEQLKQGLSSLTKNWRERKRYLYTYFLEIPPNTARNVKFFLCWDC